MVEKAASSWFFANAIKRFLFVIQSRPDRRFSGGVLQLFMKQSTFILVACFCLLQKVELALVAWPIANCPLLIGRTAYPAGKEMSFPAFQVLNSRKLSAARKNFRWLCNKSTQLATILLNKPLIAKQGSRKRI